ncbi:MAG: GIY-YIG nuclease family protein [Alphaproteobacteria bacterium]|nr:GIY-YIG nuclease family protein [Alphaproteobacteria bacterium]
MFYVYILESQSVPNTFYTGYTTDLKQRLSQHNSGQSLHTRKFIPWKLKNYVAFTDEHKARAFEEYLKTHSGRIFCKKHF